MIRTSLSLFRKCKMTPHKRFSKMISQNVKNLESVLLAEPHVAVMFCCRTLIHSEKVSCRTLQIAEPKALNLEKDCLAEPWNVGSFEVCPSLSLSLSLEGFRNKHPLTRSWATKASSSSVRAKGAMRSSWPRSRTEHWLSLEDNLLMHKVPRANFRWVAKTWRNILPILVLQLGVKWWKHCLSPALWQGPSLISVDLR